MLPLPHKPQQEREMFIEEIKAELAKRAGTDDVPEVYANQAASWINTLLRIIDALATR